MTPDLQARAAALLDRMTDGVNRGQCFSNVDVRNLQAILTDYLAVESLPATRDEASADDLRDMGLMVAAHNDYRLNGNFHTFWLFTRADGMSFKGEARTDREALNQIRALKSQPGKDT